MNNEDLKRFYPKSSNEDKSNGFVRYNKDGTIDAGENIAEKTQGKLYIGDTEFDGSSDVYVSAEDLGVANACCYKGTVSTYDNLPTSDLMTGDVYLVTSTGDSYMWTGTKWTGFGNSKLYKHHISFVYDVSGDYVYVTVEVISTSKTTVSDLTSLKELLGYSTLTEGEIYPIGTVIYSKVTADGSVSSPIISIYFEGDLLVALNALGNENNNMSSSSIIDFILEI